MNDGENNGQVLPPGSGGLVDINRMPPDVWRGILNRLNDKAQVTTKLFRNNYRVELHDIKNLLEKLRSEFEHFEPLLNESARVSFILTGGKRYEFSSWEQFSSFDSTQSEKTKSLQVEVTFDIVRKESDAPERYSIQLAFQNLAASTFGIVLGNFAVTTLGEFPTPPAPISATVRYVNFTLGKNLIATIDEWEKSLNRGDQKFVLWIQRRSNTISKVLFSASLIAGVLAAGVLSSGASVSSDVLSSFSLTFLLFGVVGYFLASSFENGIDRVVPRNVVTLTKGDQNREGRRYKKNLSNLFRAAVSAIVICAQFVVGLWPEHSRNIINSVLSFGG